MLSWLDKVLAQIHTLEMRVLELEFPRRRATPPLLAALRRRRSDLILGRSLVHLGRRQTLALEIGGEIDHVGHLESVPQFAKLGIDRLYNCLLYTSPSPRD